MNRDNTLIWFSYSPSAYFSDDIVAGMDIEVYIHPVVLTLYPERGRAYEV